ncbi:MAG: alpha-galactosidase [Anaerolineae bacterium]|nr:alpha-galactosidase [Anaerolineae bacterium]
MAESRCLSYDSAGVILVENGSDPLVRGSAELNYCARGKTCLMRITGPDPVSDTEGLEATWHWEPQDGGFDVWLEIANRGAVDFLLDTLDVLAIHSAAGGVLNIGSHVTQWSFYQNGWDSTSPTFARHTVESYYTEPGTPEYHRLHSPHWDAERPNDLVSEWVTVIASRTPAPHARSVLFGFVTVTDQLSEIRMAIEGGSHASLIARCHLDEVALHPGQSMRSECLWVRFGDDPLELLEMWADRVAGISGARLSSAPLSGWCPRHCFRGGATAQDVRRNISSLEDYGVPLDVILIDDGYPAAVGDWLSPSGNFPGGMKSLTAEIQAAGYQAGICISPYGVGENSMLYTEHPEWVLRDEFGEPVLAWMFEDTPCYVLDCTHPDALIWLETMFRRMHERWGITFFELEHMSAAALPGCRYDPDTTRAQAVRFGVAAIRGAVGEETFLLACGAPLGPCVGLVDGLRIGPSVDPIWYPLWSHDLSLPSTGNALRNSLSRAFMQGRLWQNDPDCVLIRRRGHESELVLNEMRTQVALAALSGGITFDSDDIATLRPGRLKYLRQILPPTGVAARPVDLFDHEIPRLLVLPINREWGSWWIAAVVNWDDRTTETTVSLTDLGLPAARYHVYHYWRRRYLGIIEDMVTITRHQPHETAVLMFKPVCDRPGLLTTTFHVCQGLMEVGSCHWNASKGSLSVVLQKRGRQFGQVLFAVPDGWYATEARVNGVKRSLAEVGPGVLSLGLTLDEVADIILAFGGGT